MEALQRWLARRRASGLFAGLVVPAYVFVTCTLVTVAVLCAVWEGVEPGVTRGCALHAGAALSGDPDVFAEHVAPGCSHLSAGEARDAILWDVPLVFVYGIAGTALLWWLWPRAWRVARLRRARWAAFLPAIAGAFDLVEDMFVLIGLGEGPSLTGFAAHAAAAAGWWKWALVVVALLLTIACICGAAGNRRVPASPRPRPARRHGGPVHDAVGICLSGGGIRSASCAAGALRALDRHGLFGRARWMTAVSGGAYSASAWFVARSRPSDPELLRYLRKNRRYLSTGRGGLGATFVTGAVLVAFNVVVLAFLGALLAWPVGYLASTWAVQPELRGFGYAGVATQSLDLPLRLLLPGLAGLALALSLWIVGLFLWDPARRNVLRAGAFFAAGGVALLALMAGIPVAMTETPKAWEAVHDNPLTGAGLVSILPAAGLVAALAWLVVRPFASAAKRLGGILLGLVALLYAGRVATDAAYREGWFAWSPARYAALVAGFCFFYFVANAQSWSLFRLYYLRLRSTFATTRDRARRAHGAPGEAGVYPLSLEHEPDWAAYRKSTGPELVVCAAAQRNEDHVTGVRALSLTFSPTEVALHEPVFDDFGTTLLRRDAVVEPERYARALRGPGRWGPRLGSVSASVAMSGAAFTSAMGRHSLGTTNALLAALNLRLGTWMPNPRYELPDRPLKKPRLNYLLKELVGVYDPDDPYVYVTDGGHWENLGLVELVRRRARWIVCMDAGGDEPDSFTTLEEAIVAARVECGAEIVIDLEPLKRRDGRLPKTSNAVGVVRYHSCGGVGPDDCEVGLLFYGKAMLAQDSPINTLSYSLRDRLYPRYPTYDQFLSEDEFMNLVRLGDWVGRRLALDFTAYTPPE